MKRFRDTVSISVRLPAREAMPLFTARGERRWVEGWNPEFPAGEPGEEDEGTVFVTSMGGRTTYWVVAVKEAEVVRYGRITPGLAAGTVEVRQAQADAGTTRVEVTYDLTALTEEGATELDAFAAGYQEEIGGWEDLIRGSLPPFG